MLISANMNTAGSNLFLNMFLKWSANCSNHILTHSQMGGVVVNLKGILQLQHSLAVKVLPDSCSQIKTTVQDDM